MGAGNIQKGSGSRPADVPQQIAHDAESKAASTREGRPTTRSSRAASQVPAGLSPRGPHGADASAAAARRRSSSAASALLAQRRGGAADEGAPDIAIDMRRAQAASPRGEGQPVAEADEQRQPGHALAHQAQQAAQTPGRQMHAAVAAFNRAGAAPTLAQQRAAFNAALAHSTAPGGKTEVAGAIAAQGLTTGLVAGTTFGVGRTMGMPTTYAKPQHGAPPLGDAFKQQAVNAAGSTAGGLAGALVSQGLLPSVASMMPKMAKVPVKMLVPDSGNPAADVALRAEITQMQNRLASLGSPQNAVIGGAYFGAAMLVRSGAEAKLGAQQGPAGFASAVPLSFAAGAAWGATMAANMARAKVEVPNASDPNGEPVKLNAFYAQPSNAKLSVAPWMPELNKPWKDIGRQTLESAGGRAAALGAAGAILQLSEVGNQHLSDTAVILPKASELAVAAAVYFLMLGAVGKKEAQRRVPAQPAAAEQEMVIRGNPLASPEGRAARDEA
jgi:hypothetical protein